MNTRLFCFVYAAPVGRRSLSGCFCDLLLLRLSGQVFYPDALTGIGLDVGLQEDLLADLQRVIFPKHRLYEGVCRQFEMADETVVDHDPLGAVFALSLRLIDVDVVDQLLQQRRREGLHLHKAADRPQEQIPSLFRGVKAFDLFPETVIYCGWMCFDAQCIITASRKWGA